MDKHISDIIVQVCQQQGINYESINPNYVAFCNDAKHLGELYVQLKGIASELCEIATRHNLPALQQMLSDDLNELDKLAHDFIKVAKKIQEETPNE